MNKIDLLITLTQETDNENNVTIAFAMGNAALDKGYHVEIVLLSNAVHMAKKDFAKIDIGEPFPAIEEILPSFLEKGGKIKVCKACMAHNGVKEEELLPEAIVIQAPDVIDLVMTAEKSLQLN